MRATKRKPAPRRGGPSTEGRREIARGIERILGSNTPERAEFDRAVGGGCNRVELSCRLLEVEDEFLRPRDSFLPAREINKLPAEERKLAALLDKRNFSPRRNAIPPHLLALPDLLREDAAFHAGQEQTPVVIRDGQELIVVMPEAYVLPKGMKRPRGEPFVALPPGAERNAAPISEPLSGKKLRLLEYVGQKTRIRGADLLRLVARLILAAKGRARDADVSDRKGKCPIDYETEALRKLAEGSGFWTTFSGVTAP